MLYHTTRRLIVKTFQEAELSSVAQRTLPRLVAGIDHLGIDVTFLAAGASRFTRELIGRERDEEAVQILTKYLTTNILRRLKVKKSIALFMDGTDPLWKVHHLRQYPGKVFDRAFYRSAASPMVYLMENQLFKVVEELRGTSSVLECIVSGPSTPGPAAMKMTAWLHDLGTRALPLETVDQRLRLHNGEDVQPGQKSDVLPGAPVTKHDSIVLIGSEEHIHLNAWGATTWTPTSVTSSASFTTLSFDQRDPYSLTLADSLEWLSMGDVYATAVKASGKEAEKLNSSALKQAEPLHVSPSTRTEKKAQHDLAALRMDMVWLYLLAFGSTALGLPPLSNTLSFPLLMTAYSQEMSRKQKMEQDNKKPATGTTDSETACPSVHGVLIHMYPSQRVPGKSTTDESITTASSTPSPLRLHVEALRRIIAGATQKTSSPAGLYHPGVAHYLEVALQALHAYVCGFLPNPLYAPAESKANFGEKGMRGVTMENVLSHLQFLADASQRPAKSASTSVLKSSPQPPVRHVSFASPFTENSVAVSYTELFSRCASLTSPAPTALTGAQQLCLCTTKPEYMEQVLPVMTRGHVPTAEQIKPIVAARTVADALPLVQALIPPQHAPFLTEKGEEKSESGEEKGEGDSSSNTDSLEPGVMDGALCYHPSHYVTRSGAGPLNPWKYFSICLGLKSEVISPQCFP